MERDNMEKNGFPFKGNIFVSFFYELKNINKSLPALTKNKLFISQKKP
jgi:hypothetical protein